MSNVKFESYGSKFVKEISKANSKEEIFESLKKACCKTADEKEVSKEISAMDFPIKKEVAKLKAVMAKIKIQQQEVKLQKSMAAAGNSINKAKNVIYKYLVGEKTFSKAQDYTIIGMSEYVEKGFGSPEDYKNEVKDLFALQKSAPEKQKQENKVSIKTDHHQYAEAGIGM